MLKKFGADILAWARQIQNRGPCIAYCKAPSDWVYRRWIGGQLVPVPPSLSIAFDIDDHSFRIIAAGFAEGDQWDSLMRKWKKRPIRTLRLQANSGQDRQSCRASRCSICESDKQDPATQDVEQDMWNKTALKSATIGRGAILTPTTTYPAQSPHPRRANNQPDFG